VNFFADPSRRPHAFILRAFEERVTKGEGVWAPQDEGFELLKACFDSGSEVLS